MIRIRELRELERVEHRVLGALRFVDAATGVDIRTPLEVRAVEGDAVLVRNQSGLWVVDSWSDLAPHAASFDEPPPAPAPGSRLLQLSVRDPLGGYLPRRVALALPRDPEAEDEADSLFRPREVQMFPTPASPTGANWSVLRVTVTEEDTGDALGGALVLVRRNGDIMARGLTDGRGEALVAIVGVPMLTFGEDDEVVVVDEVAVVVSAVFRSIVGPRTPMAALRAGTPPPVPEVDPETLEAASDVLPQAALPLAVAARRSQAVPLAIDLP